MEGLALGSAFFKFGLDSLQAVRGLSDFGAGVAGMTGKVVPQVRGVKSGMDNLSNGLDGVFRGFDRFTRGIRGVTPAIAAHQENIYRLEDAIKRTDRELDIAKLRLNEKRAAEQRNIESTALLASRLEEANNKLSIHGASIIEAKQKLDDLRNSTQIHSQNISIQSDKTLKAREQFELYQAKVAESAAKLRQLRDAQANNIAEEEKQQAVIDRVTASYKNFADQAVVATTKLKQMQELDPAVELAKQGARVKEVTIDYEQMKIKAGQASQALSVLAKAGQQNTREYRDQALVARDTAAARDRLFQQIKLEVGSYKQLEIKVKDYNSAIKQQSSLVDVLNAKSAEELAKSKAMAGELTILKQKHADVTTTIERRGQELAKLQREEQELSQTYQREVQALDRLRAAGGADAAAIAKQEALVDKLTGSYNAQRLSVAALQQEMQTAEARQLRLARETQSAEKNIRDLTGSQQRYKAQLELTAQRAEQTAAREERLAKKRAEAKAKTDQSSSAHQRFGNILGWLTGLFGRAEQGEARFASQTQRLTSITAAVNQRLFSFSSFLRDVAVSTLGNVLANGISNAVFGLRSLTTTALDSFKAHEMLGLSLKALSARQLVSSGQFKSLADAEGAATQMSEQLIKWMERLAITSPFSVDDISGAFRLANALGFTSSQAQRLIKDTVDWAAATGGTGDSIESVIRALGQMHNTGHVTLEDINQMTDAGLSARDVLRNEFAPEIKASGKSLEDLISAGLLPADRAITALAENMETDFGGAAAKAGNSMTGLLASLSDIKNAGLREFFSSTFEAIKTPLSNLVAFLQNPETTGAIRAFGEMLGGAVGQALLWLGQVAFPAVMQAAQTFVPIVIEAFSGIAALASEAYEWGYGIGEQLASGLADTIDMVVSIISELGSVIASWMEPFSPPKFLPEIDIWGQKTGQLYLDSFAMADPSTLATRFGPIIRTGLDMNQALSRQSGRVAAETYFAGWGEADFGILSNVQRGISDFLQNMVTAGTLDQKALIPLALGTDDQIARAIQELRQTGSISEQTFRQIRNAANNAADGMGDYIESMLRSEVASRELREAQERLNQVTEEYDAKLDPLRAKREALDRAEQDAERQAEIARLQRQLTTEGPAGLGPDKVKLQRELDKLLLDQQIEQTERERDVAVDAEQAKVDAAQKAADAAQAELSWRQAVLDQQKQQNELIQRQIDLTTERGQRTAEEIAKEDAAAKEKYEFEHASVQDQIALLEAKQTQARMGSKEWYDLQDQIEAKQEEARRKEEQGDKRSVDSDKKAQAEAKKREDAEYKARLAAAETEEERLRIMQEEQAKYGEGTAEYLDLQADIEKQQDRVAKSSDSKAKAVAKASEAEFDHALAMADSADKVQMLQERLAQLDPTSKEYTKRQEELKKATDAQQKATQQLSDAEFEAKFAAQDRAGKIAMLQEKLGGLNQGTLEYERTLKRLNTLEAQGGGAGGRGKGKGAPLGGKPFAGLTEVGDTVDKVSGSFTKVTDAVNKAKEKFLEFRARLDPIFNWLKSHSDIIVFVLQKLAMSFAIALVVEKLVKPILSLVWGFRQFLTWGNAVFALMALLGYAWKTNLGGLRDIVADVWGKIQGPLHNILLIFERIKVAFAAGGISSAFAAFMAQLGSLGSNLGRIGATVWSGIVQWVEPFTKFLSEMFQKVVEWAQGGGLATAFENLIVAIGEFFSSLSSSDVIGTGLVGLIAGIGTVLQAVGKGVLAGLIRVWPGMLAGLMDLWNGVRQWFDDHFRDVLQIIGVALGGILAGVGELLFALVPKLLNTLVDVAAWLLPLLPDILSGVVTALTLLGTWIISRGIPLGIKAVTSVVTNLLNRIGEMLPSLGLNLGRLIGSTLSKLLIMLVTGIGALVVQLWQSIQDGTFIEGLKNLVSAVFTFLGGILRGVAGLLIGIVVGLFEPFIDAGRAAIAGLGEGILGGATWLIQLAVDMFNNFVQSIKNFLGISSPSTVFAAIGQALLDGLWSTLQGITNLVTTIIQWFADLEDAVLIGITTFIANFIAAVLTWEEMVLTGISVFIDKFIEFVAGLITTITTKFGTFFSDQITAFTTSFDKLREVWEGWDTRIRGIVGAIVTFLSRSWDGIRNTASTAWEGIKGTIISMFSPIAEGIDSIVNGAGGVASILSGAWTSIQGTATTGWENITAAAKSAFTITEKIHDVIYGFTGVKNMLGSAWLEIQTMSGDAWTAVAGKITGAFSGIKQKVKDAINEVIDAVNEAIRTINSIPGVPHLSEIPRLALGAMYAKGGLTMVGEEGIEVVNLPRGSEVQSVGRSSMTLARLFENQTDALSRAIAGLGRDFLGSVGGEFARISGQQSEQMARQLGGALRQQSMIDRASGVEEKPRVERQVERHDHWNMTVNTHATVPTVVQDFGTMRARRGVR